MSGYSRSCVSDCNPHEQKRQHDPEYQCHRKHRLSPKFDDRSWWLLRRSLSIIGIDAVFAASFPSISRIPLQCSLRMILAQGLPDLPKGVCVSPWFWTRSKRSRTRSNRSTSPSVARAARGSAAMTTTITMLPHKFNQFFFEENWDLGIYEHSGLFYTRIL